MHWSNFHFWYIDIFGESNYVEIFFSGIEIELCGRSLLARILFFILIFLSDVGFAYFFNFFFIITVFRPNITYIGVVHPITKCVPSLCLQMTSPYRRSSPGSRLWNPQRDRRALVLGHRAYTALRHKLAPRTNCHLQTEKQWMKRLQITTYPDWRHFQREKTWIIIIIIMMMMMMMIIHSTSIAQCP